MTSPSSNWSTASSSAASSVPASTTIEKGLRAGEDSGASLCGGSKRASGGFDDDRDGKGKMLGGCGASVSLTRTEMGLTKEVSEMVERWLGICWEGMSRLELMRREVRMIE